MIFDPDYNKLLCFELISSIKDPEFNKTLLDLDVVNKNDIEMLKNKKNNKFYFIIYWKPTITTCSFASQIGLSIHLMLLKNFPNYNYYKFEILIKEGDHENYKLLNKQMNDKERLKGALENKELYKFINTLTEYDYN